MRFDMNTLKFKPNEPCNIFGLISEMTERVMDPRRRALEMEKDRLFLKPIENLDEEKDVIFYSKQVIGLNKVKENFDQHIQFLQEIGMIREKDSYGKVKRWSLNSFRSFHISIVNALLKSDVNLRAFSNHSSSYVDDNYYLNGDPERRVRDRMRIAYLIDKFIFKMFHKDIFNELRKRIEFFENHRENFDIKSKFVLILQ